MAETGAARAFQTSNLLVTVTVQRVEVEATVSLPGSLWIVPTAEGDHLLVARELGFSVPEAVVGVLGSHHVRADAWVAPAPVLRDPAVAGFVARLGPTESLRLDPAGVSLWKIVPAGMRRANLELKDWVSDKGSAALSLASSLAPRDHHA